MDEKSINSPPLIGNVSPMSPPPIPPQRPFPITAIPPTSKITETTNERVMLQPRASIEPEVMQNTSPQAAKLCSDLNAKEKAESNRNIQTTIQTTDLTEICTALQTTRNLFENQHLAVEREIFQILSTFIKMKTSSIQEPYQKSMYRINLLCQLTGRGLITQTMASRVSQIFFQMAPIIQPNQLHNLIAIHH